MAELFDDIILDGTDAVWTDVRGYASLNALVAAVGTQACNVYIPAPINLDVSLTIPSTYTLHFFNGGCIDILSGVTLTLETRSIHATQPIVTGVGTLAFADGTVVDTRWFASFADAVAQAGDATVTLHVTQPDEVYANITLGDTLTLLWTTPGLYPFHQRGLHPIQRGAASRRRLCHPCRGWDGRVQGRCAVEVELDSLPSHC